MRFGVESVIFGGGFACKASSRFWFSFLEVGPIRDKVERGLLGLGVAPLGERFVLLVGLICYGRLMV